MIVNRSSGLRRRFRWPAIVFIVVAALFGQAAKAQQHPLDPLTADELLQVRDILTASRQFSAETNFAWIVLDEPPKASVVAFAPGASLARRASVTAIDYDKRKTFAVIVDIPARRIASLTDLRGLQPGLDDRETLMARAIIDDDPRIKEALVKRGLRVTGKPSDTVRLFTMAFGHDPKFPLPEGATRLVRVLFAADQDGVNDFSPFIDSLMAVVDLYSKRVLKLYDTQGVASVKVPHDAFDPSVRGTPRASKPVVPTQPQGSNLVVDGQVVTWQNWRFRFGFNAREGLVLYQLAFNDGGRWRPVAYRASLAGLVTSYGDPSELWSWMEFDDEGNFGLGYLSSAVTPGREVPATAATLTAVLPNSNRPAFSDHVEDRIFVYERDAGNLLFYQQEERRIHARATDLVIGFLVSLGNYTYGITWVFKQDGSFAFEAELGGQVLTKFVAAKNCEVCKLLIQGAGPNGESRTYEAVGDDRYGTVVHPNVAAVNHQHWLNLRLDFDIDGSANAVMERNVKRASPDARFFTTTYTVFGKSSEAKRRADGHGASSWMIYNPRSVSSLGRPAGYAVVPMENTPTMFPRSREKDEESFTFSHFWATPYREGQLYANGAYPSQPGKTYADTLYHYAGSEPIFDQDIVVWYSMGGTHVPRPEDYPLMTSMRMSVGFRPEGFFVRNPVLGLGEVHP
jgi:primary-amine oxidase